MKSFFQTVLIMLLLLLTTGTLYADKHETIQQLAYQSKLDIRLEGSESFFILSIGPAEAGKMQPDLGDLRMMSNGAELGYAQIHPQVDRDRAKFEQPPGEALSVKDAEWIEADVTSINQTKESQLVIDLEHQHRITSEWLLQTEEKGFYRQVITEGSHDKSQWRTIGTSFMFRGIADTDEMISYRYGPETYRYIRIRIKNEDNEPLAIRSVKVKVHPVQIIVKAPALRSEKSLPIVAYWGNANMQSPSYDVKQLMVGSDLEKIPTFALVGHEPNPNYEPTQPAVPLTERFPFVLPSVLVLLIVVVAYLLYRNMKKVKQ